MIATKPKTNFWDMGQLAQSGLFLAPFEGYTLERSVGQNDYKYDFTIGDIKRWFQLHEPRKVWPGYDPLKLPMDDSRRLNWNRDKGYDPYEVERGRSRIRSIHDRNRRKVGL